MRSLIATRPRRLGWTALACLFVTCVSLYLTWSTSAHVYRLLTDGEIMKRFIVFPALVAVATLALLTACANTPERAITVSSASAPPAPDPVKSYMAQVVGVQWLNPLQRRDYPTEWQLLWTLGLAKPNKNDDMVRNDPDSFTTVKVVSSIVGSSRSETFEGYQHKYFEALTTLFHDNYFKYSTSFYNAHSLTDKATWRELAGIHVEFALPQGRLDPKAVEASTRDRMIKLFAIGNTYFPTAWTRNTPPDVHVTLGGPNAGFTSLSAALDYLQAHPTETAWAMNWDAPSFPPKGRQMNENMVLLVLAGPQYKTGREPLAWIGYPAVAKLSDYEIKQGQPSRVIQAWQAALTTAATNAGKQPIDIGYVIHDANNTHADSSDRIGNLAQGLTLNAPELDFSKQAFNTPALLGEMGAGTALTNVALGIAYANHLGKNVLVAGTTELAQPTALLVTPPAKVRPIDPEEGWFRARGENNAYLMWWGIRHNATYHRQGYSD